MKVQFLQDGLVTLHIGLRQPRIARLSSLLNYLTQHFNGRSFQKRGMRRQECDNSLASIISNEQKNRKYVTERNGKQERWSSSSFR